MVDVSLKASFMVRVESFHITTRIESTGHVNVFSAKLALTQSLARKVVSLVIAAVIRDAAVIPQNHFGGGSPIIY